MQKRLLRLHGTAIGSSPCQLWLEGARLGPESLVSSGMSLTLTTAAPAGA